MDQSFYWALPMRFSPQFRCWGDECALFDSESGDTHVVDAVASSILTQLAGGALATSAIVVELTEGLSAEVQMAAQDHVVAALIAMEAKNLVRRVPV